MLYSCTRMATVGVKGLRNLHCAKVSEVKQTQAAWLSGGKRVGLDQRCTRALGAKLVLRWMTVGGCSQPPRSTQPSIPPG